MIALIDADIVAYRCAASAEKDPEWVAVARTRELVEQILAETKATEYKLYLTGDNNFRRKIYPEYKANRTQPKPIHLIACKQYLVTDWGAEVQDTIEADDALGIAQDNGYPDYDIPAEIFDTVICSIDKDLKQVPGNHYNFVKKEWDLVQPYQGLLAFYTQLLVGDPGDNIKGCPGIGKAKAPRMLEGCKTEQEMFDVCRDAYNDDINLFMNGHLLYIWRKENDSWNPARFIEQDRDHESESTLPTVEATTPSTELGLTN